MSRVSVTNPFDLLTDENEDRTNVQAPKAPKEQKPAAPKAPAQNKPAATGAAKAPAKPAAKTAAAAKPQEQKAAKPAGDKPAGAKPQQANNVRAPGAPREANTGLVEREKEYRGPRGGGERRNDRPRGAAVPRGDKRTFERKSGTGRAPNEVKRGGQGKGNWGGEIESAEALKEEKPVAGEEKEEEVKEGEEKPAAEGEEKAAAEGEKKEEEKKEEKQELGLEEYYAKLKAKAPKVEALKPRTVSADGFDGLVALKRDEETEVKKEKKDAKKSTKKADEEDFKTDAKLAEKLISFQTHRDTFRGKGPRGDRNDRDRPYNDRPYQGRREDSYKKGPRNAPAQQQASPAAEASAQFKSADFPALGPHGSSPADQPVKA